MIMSELNKTDQFNAAIPKLHNYLARNPHLSQDYLMRELSSGMQDMVKGALENYKNSLSDSGSTPN